VAEDEQSAMNYEQDVDDHKQMMRVPKGVESRDVVEGPRQLDQTPSKPLRSKRERDRHKNNHYDSSDTLYGPPKPPVIGLVVMQVISNGPLEQSVVGEDNTREITGQMESCMEESPNCNRSCNHLRLSS
jgi:hypothetical protein